VQLQRIRRWLAPAPPAPPNSVLFNESIGWPKHPWTGRPTPLYPYQFEIIDAPERFLLVVKARKIGITEAIIRRAAYLALSRYAGYQVLFVSQREDHSAMMMRRLQSLFRDSPYERLVEKATAEYLRLQNGCEIYSLPSTAQSLRGFPRVKAVYLDEAAHFVRLNDETIYAALRPSLINTQGDFVIVSTPRGQRGFFYQLYRDDDTFRKFLLPYHVAPGLISPDRIAEEKRALGPFFAQEYECAFLSAQNAAIPPELIAHSLDDYELDPE
jgi:hypothetical protein